ncbi:CAP domain-containing protein [Bdellovibrio sp. HCB337]|uniref:CAP domain-containing protein n=1 Tax=Bdellovibrio sp. HCB337 TaxID=3394358 RepID=UPI0039A46168
MKTFAVFTLCGFLLLMTACSSGDAGSGAGSMGFASTAGEAYRNFPGGDCYSMDEYSCLAFKATNVQRLAYGLTEMSFCQACYEMAIEQSTDMHVRGYFDHQRPDETFAHRATRFGLSDGAGENIAWGKVGEVVVDLWMNSSGHRANILNPNYRSFAIGTWGLYTTQVFYIGTDK